MRISQQSIVQQNKRNRTFAFIGLIAFSTISAILDVAFYYVEGFETASFLTSILLIPLFIIFWCKFDSAARNRRFRFTDGLAIYLIGIIAVPTHFWKTRSPQGFLLTLGGLYLYLVPALTYSLSWFLTAEILHKLSYYS